MSAEGILYSDYSILVGNFMCYCPECKKACSLVWDNGMLICEECGESIYPRSDTQVRDSYAKRSSCLKSMRQEMYCIDQFPSIGKTISFPGIRKAVKMIEPFRVRISMYYVTGLLGDYIIEDEFGSLSFCDEDVFEYAYNLYKTGGKHIYSTIKMRRKIKDDMNQFRKELKRVSKIKESK